MRKERIPAGQCRENALAAMFATACPSCAAVNWRSILYAARQWRPPPRLSRADWGELAESEALFAAVQATKDFNAERGIPLAAFVALRIRHRILAAYRKEWSYGLSYPGMIDKYLECSVESSPTSDDQDALLAAIGNLSPTTKEVITALYLECKTETDVAHTLRISQQAVSKRKQKALNRLRSELRSIIGT